MARREAWSPQFRVRVRAQGRERSKWSPCAAPRGMEAVKKVALASGCTLFGKACIFQITRKYDFGNKNLKFIFKIKNKCLHLGDYGLVSPFSSIKSDTGLCLR